MPEPTPRPIRLPRLLPVPAADPAYDEAPTGRLSADAAVLDAPPRTYGALALASGGGPLLHGPSGALPDERRLRGLGRAMAEILCGRRPPATVQGRLSERAYGELIRAGKMIDAPRPPMVGAPHIQRPDDGVVEMCLLIHCGPRSHALALRLERRGVQWLVTDFETA
ncbi:Rv3235 family protein [Microtetraspora malaysiensis]|uniref:Rv3235 family protein n=1 Tax=Microtetraspora malaysiensis TaxID=161358 RepID=UPI003D8BB5F5